MICIRCGEPSERVWCSTCVAKVCCSQRRHCVHRPARNGFARSALAAAALLMAASCSTAGGGGDQVANRRPTASSAPSPAPDRSRWAVERTVPEPTTSTRVTAPVRASRSKPAVRSTQPPRVERAPAPTAPPAPPAAAPAGECGPGKKSRSLSDRCWGPLLARYPWAGGLAKALGVLYCESTGDQNATNGIHHSLMQVANGPYDPEANIAAAWSIYREREKRGQAGWSAWSCA